MQKLNGIFKLVLLFSLLTKSCLAAVNTPDEYELKVIIIYKILQFVEWPENVLTNNESNINFCLLGEHSFQNALPMIEGKTIKQHIIKVKKIDSVKQAVDCHALYIDLPEKDFNEAISELKDNPILTITDNTDFEKSQVMIILNKKQRKIRFKIHLEKVKQAKLFISSQLLDLADII